MKQLLLPLLWLLSLSAPSSLAEQVMRCNDCLVVAKLLERDVVQLEAARKHDAVGSADGGGGEHSPRVGRKLPYQLSEKEVDGVLDGVCAQLPLLYGEQGAKWEAPCTRLIEAHHAKLGDALYQHGWRAVRRALCKDLAGLCSTHDLYDSGEL